MHYTLYTYIYYKDEDDDEDEDKNEDEDEVGNVVNNNNINGKGNNKNNHKKYVIHINKIKIYRKKISNCFALKALKKSTPTIRLSLDGFMVKCPTWTK